MPGKVDHRRKGEHKHLTEKRIALSKLTVRQRKFVSEYAIHLDAQKAAVAAGYAQGQFGYRLLKNPAVALALQGTLERRTQRATLTTDKVLEDLEETRIKALEDKDYRAAVKCSELQGKYLRMFAEKVEVSGAMKITVLMDLREEADEQRD